MGVGGGDVCVWGVMWCGWWGAGGCGGLEGWNNVVRQWCCKFG